MSSTRSLARSSTTATTTRANHEHEDTKHPPDRAECTSTTPQREAEPCRREHGWTRRSRSTRHRRTTDGLVLRQRELHRQRVGVCTPSSANACIGEGLARCCSTRMGTHGVRSREARRLVLRLRSPGRSFRGFECWLTDTDAYSYVWCERMEHLHSDVQQADRLLPVRDEELLELGWIQLHQSASLVCGDTLLSLRRLQLRPALVACKILSPVELSAAGNRAVPLAAGDLHRRVPELGVRAMVWTPCSTWTRKARVRARSLSSGAVCSDAGERNDHRGPRTRTQQRPRRRRRRPRRWCWRWRSR